MPSVCSASQQILEYRLALAKAFAEDGQCCCPGRAVQVLDDYLDYIECELSHTETMVNVSQIQEMLLEISCIIRSSNQAVDGQVYSRTLHRLTGIYGRGFSSLNREALSLTASDYAEVIETISQQYPDYDYSEVIGQLLHYMNLLFRQKNGAWVTIYEHLSSMPESIQAVQTLQQIRFYEIQNWVEEGVQNLFRIQSDLRLRVRRVEQDVARLERRIQAEMRRADQVCAEQTTFPEGNVFSLCRKRMQQRVAMLAEKRDRAASEAAGKLQLIELLDTNILEFAGKLKEARRNYLVRLVYST